VWVWSRGKAGYGAVVVGGCKELSAGLYAAHALWGCRREFFIAADAWKDPRHGVGCNSLLGFFFRSSEDYVLNNRKTSSCLTLCDDFCMLYASKYSEWPIDICGNIACKLTMDDEWSLIIYLLNM
jgi:hypothetical protein